MGRKIIGIIGIGLALSVLFVSIKINDLNSTELAGIDLGTRFLSKDDDVQLLKLLVNAGIYPANSEFELLPLAYKSYLLLISNFVKLSKDEQEEKLSEVKTLEDYERLVDLSKAENAKLVDEKIREIRESIDDYKTLQITLIVLIVITQIILLPNSKKE